MALNNATIGAKDGAVLLTGATGLLGGELLTRLLEQTDRHVVALVRRPLPIQHPRLSLLMADLTDDGPLPTPDRPVSQVIHCAASVSFNLPLEEQRQINVGGTRRLIELATSLPGLERFMHVSTAYVAGFSEGVFGPDDLHHSNGFRNPYEQSKHEAEVMVRESGLPVQVIRPSIVVGDQKTGRTTSFNVIYPLWKSYSRGHLQMAPGRVDAHVDAVPIDYIADGMMALLDVEPGKTHLLVSGEHAAKVQDLVDLASDYFELPPAQIVSRAEIDEIISQLPDEYRETAEATLAKWELLLPYFEVAVEYRDPETVQFLAERGITVRPLPGYFDRLMEYATQTNWGKEPLSAAA